MAEPAWDVVQFADAFPIAVEVDREHAARDRVRNQKAIRVPARALEVTAAGEERAKRSRRRAQRLHGPGAVFTAPERTLSRRCFGLRPTSPAQRGPPRFRAPIRGVLLGCSMP